MRFTCN
jgi:hypothetical protein